MEYDERPIISSYDPGPGDDSEGIPRRHLDGWVKIQLPNGRIRVCKVQTVRVLERLSLEVLYPARQGYERYESGFLWSSIDRIPEEEAFAFLEKHGVPLPGKAQSTTAE